MALSKYDIPFVYERPLDGGTGQTVPKEPRGTGLIFG